MIYMNLTEKVSYLQGLMDGLGYSDDSNEGKILRYMTGILSDMAETVSDMQVEIDEMTEVIDAIDEDLGEIESDFYECEDDDCCDCDDDCDCDCDDEDELYEVQCPTCGDVICLNEDMLGEGSMTCPNCSEELEFDFSDLDEDEEE